MDIEMTLQRVIATLEGKIALQSLAPGEQEILRRVDAVSFDPFPAASHRIYVDRITDFQSGTVTRTYYDYGGNKSHSEEVKLCQGELIRYLSALIVFTFDGYSPIVVPDIVRFYSLPQGAGHRFTKTDDD